MAGLWLPLENLRGGCGRGGGCGSSDDNHDDKRVSSGIISETNLDNDSLTR